MLAALVITAMDTVVADVVGIAHATRGAPDALIAAPKALTAMRGWPRAFLPPLSEEPFFVLLVILFFHLIPPFPRSGDIHFHVCVSRSA